MAMVCIDAMMIDFCPSVIVAYSDQRIRGVSKVSIETPFPILYTQETHFASSIPGSVAATLSSHHMQLCTNEPHP